MNVLAQDVKIGDFIASNYGLCIGFFGYDGNDEADTGISVSTVEEFIGDLSTPIYIGQKYSEKLKPTVSLVKNPCVSSDPYFTEFEIRGILRQIFGIRGYVWMNLLIENVGEDISYLVRVTNVRYQMVNGHVVGLILDMECDSQFGYSREQTITVSASANNAFKIYTQMSDDLNSYILPIVTITSKANGMLEFKNNTDDGWMSIFQNVVSGEVLTIDCKSEILTTSRASHTKILNDFNLHWPRLLSPVNEYVSSLSCTVQFVFRCPIRVGFVNT